MAEIEVLLDFGTPYVRLDDYNAMKERYWRQAGLTQTADDEAAKWKEHARAAVARAEAAEARAYQRLEDALFAEQRATDADIRAEETDADASRLRLELAAAKLGISALAARVAELEAQLAARQWRPVTESPHQTGEYIGYDGNIVRCVSYNSDWDSDDDWPWSDIDGIFTPVEMWRPLPPAPQEPTP